MRALGRAYRVVIANRRLVASTCALTAGFWCTSAKAKASSAAVPAFKTLDPPPPEDELKLRYLTVVFRHGARTPLARMAGESENEFHTTWAPHCEDDKTPPKPGQLTQLGRQQLIDLGQWLRARYILNSDRSTCATSGFLPKSWSAEAFYLRATGLPRTQQSAGALLHGLYPVSCPTLHDGDALVRSFADIRSMAAPKLDETMSPMWSSCDRLRELYWMHRHAPTMATLENNTRAMELRKKFANAVYVSESDSRVSWIHLSDWLHSCAVHDIPTLNTNPLMQEISTIAYGVFAGVLGGSNEMIRLTIGRFLDETLKQMELATKTSGSKRCSLIATHDTTLVPLAMTLPGVFEPSSRWLPFASNITLELLERHPKKTLGWNQESSGVHKQLPQWYVRVLYNGRETPTLMTLDDLRMHWKQWIPTDWKYECSRTHKHSIPPQKW